ncbi:hypothetical protein niasHT_026768 [Heterodera trifolii]|uniref:Uncharacterized protein n=1 Tax=Heterodera trifolii TaxID=157864 RepID=A0ABD2K8V4_9BILA
MHYRSTKRNLQTLACSKNCKNTCTNAPPSVTSKLLLAQKLENLTGRTQSLFEQCIITSVRPHRTGPDRLQEPDGACGVRVLTYERMDALFFRTTNVSPPPDNKNTKARRSATIPVPHKQPTSWLSLVQHWAAYQFQRKKSTLLAALSKQTCLFLCSEQRRASRTSKGITDPLLLSIFDSKPVNALPNIHQEVVPTKAGPTLYMHHDRAKQSVKPYGVRALPHLHKSINSPNRFIKQQSCLFIVRRLLQAGETETTTKVAPQQQPSPFNVKNKCSSQSICPRRFRPTEQN